MRVHNIPHILRFIILPLFLRSPSYVNSLPSHTYPFPQNTRQHQKLLIALKAHLAEIKVSSIFIFQIKIK